jgi:hypothetical protein
MATRNKSLRGCSLCGRRYRILRYENTHSAWDRHRKDPECQRVWRIRMYRNQGWVHAGAAGPALRNGGFNIKSLPTIVWELADTDGERTSHHEWFAPKAEVRAAMVFVGHSMSAKHRKDAIQRLLDHPEELEAVEFMVTAGGRVPRDMYLPSLRGW